MIEKSTYQNTKQKEGCSCNPYVERNKKSQFIWQKLYSRECQILYEELDEL